MHSDETIKDGSGKLTVRGESGNRHGRREAGGRQGVTTLQHGSGMRSLLFKRPEQKAAMRVRPSLLPAFLRLPKMGRYEKGRKAPSKSNASTRATHSGKASANAATGRWAMTSVQNRAGQNCAREARGTRQWWTRSTQEVKVKEDENADGHKRSMVARRTKKRECAKKEQARREEQSIGRRLTDVITIRNFYMAQNSFFN